MKSFFLIFKSEIFAGAGIVLLLAGCGFYSHIVWNLLFLLGSVLFFFAALKCKPRNVQASDEPVLSPEKHYLVFFIIGPYASRWFVNGETATDDDPHSQAVWITEPEAQNLASRLSLARQRYKNARFMAYFPLLPDGHITADALISQLEQWRHALGLLTSQHPLPCLLAIYAQLSQERLSWDPDSAIWSGDANISFSHTLSLEDARKALFEQLRQGYASDSLFALQRYALSENLFHWMDKTGIMNALNKIFLLPGIKLNSLLVADYGTGFVRHGAWSRWLQERFGLLPVLSGSGTTLPFPQIHISEYTLTQYNPTGGNVVYEKPIKKWPVRLWGTVLIIALSMGVAAWTEMYRSKQVQLKLQQFSQIDTAAWQDKFDALDALEYDRQQLLACQNRLIFLNWGFSRCAQLISQIDSATEEFHRLALYNATQSLSLFAPGEADIIPSTQSDLKALIPVFKRSTNTRFLIIGHADNTGSHQNNMQLSKRRADTVRDFLVAQSGLPKDIFITQGVGDTQPMTREDSDAAHLKNRRIEIIPLIQNHLIN